MEPIQEQYSETNISILSNDPDKIEKYNVLLQKVIPIAKSATNKMQKKAAYDFIILLKSALNQSNSLVLMYLNDAIEHLLRYFSKDLQELFNGSVDWENSYHNGYALLNDLTRVIMQSILHGQKLKEFRKFCLDI